MSDATTVPPSDASTEPHLPVVSRILNEGLQPPHLYHYTDQSGFLGVISTGCMWAPFIQYLNDSREYEQGIQLIAAELQRRVSEDNELQQTLAQVVTPDSTRAWSNPIVGVMSFSKVRDDLSQWRAYAGGSGGYCIGFDGVNLLRQVNASLGALVPVRYGNRDNPQLHHTIVREFCDQLINEARTIPDDPDARAAVLWRHALDVQVICSVLKDQAFAAEEEWRAIFIGPAGDRAKMRVRGGRSTLIPYYEVQLRNNAFGTNRLPIVEVVVGPTPHEAAAVKAASVALALNSENRVVVPTTVPFRNW